MNIRERLQRKVSMTVLQRQCLIIVTLLSTLLLASVWPRFRNDALSFGWLGYVILIALFLTPLLQRDRADP